MRQALLVNTPLVIFVFIWMVILSLSSINPYNFREIGFSAGLVLISGIFAVISGYLISALVFNVSSSSKAELSNNYSTFLFSQSSLLKLTMSLFFFHLVGGLISLHVVSNLSGGIKFYVEDPLVIRQTVIAIQMGNIEGVPFLYRLGIIAINLGMLGNIFGGALFTTKGRIKYLALLPLLTSAFVDLVFVRRYAFVNGVLFWFFSYLYTNLAFHREAAGRIIRNSLISLLIITCTVFGFSYFIVAVRSPWSDDIKTYFFQSIYSYFAGSLSSLDVWWNNPNINIQFTYGQTIFRDLFKLLSRLGVWSMDDVAPVHQSFATIGHNIYLNTYTFVKAMYEDYGVSGVLGISFLWGFIAKLFVTKHLKSPTYLSLFAVVLITFSLTMSFYSFYFRNTISSIFWLTVLFGLQSMVRSYFLRHIDVPV